MNFPLYYDKETPFLPKNKRKRIDTPEELESRRRKAEEWGDAFATLPPEIILDNIVPSLWVIADFYHLMCTCRWLFNTLNNDYVWKKLFPIDPWLLEAVASYKGIKDIRDLDYKKDFHIEGHYINKYTCIKNYQRSFENIIFRSR